MALYKSVKYSKEEKITIAKEMLVKYMPFLGFMSYQLPIYLKEKFKGIAYTDGYNIVLNTKFVECNSVPSIAMILAHELGHIVYKTVFRKAKRNHKIWNIATDFIINGHLDDANNKLKNPLSWNIYIGDKKFHPLLDSTYRNMTAESVYDLFAKKSKIEISAKEVYIIDPETGDISTVNDNEIKASSVIARAYQKAQEEMKRRGACSDCFMEVVKVSLSKQITWKYFLKKTLRTRGFEHQDASRPSRRCLLNRALGISKFYHPRLRASRPQNIAVCIDDSGSIDSKALKMFLGELNNCLRENSGMVAYLYSCDTKVNDIGVFKDRLPEEIAFLGRGGTIFTPALKHMQNLMKKDSELKTLFYFTDGYGDNEEVAKMRLNFKLIWCVTTDVKLPKGINIKIDPYV